MSKKTIYERILELSQTGISKRYAGKILFDEGYSTSIENARNRVRYFTGSLGAVHFESAENTSQLIDWETGLPEPEKSEFGIKEIDTVKGIACLFDIHLPFHDLRTINEVLERANEYDTLIIQEVFDFYGLSKFDKTRVMRPAQEQEAFFQFMDHVRKLLPEHRIIFQQGNHDERYKLYLWKSAQAVADMQGMSFAEIMAFDDWQIEAIPERNLLKYRSLYIGHGHEIGIRSGGVSPARTFSLKTNGNFIGGHLHRSSEYITKNIGDEVNGCWSVGCACELHPRFMPINQWNNGYAIIRPHKEKNFKVENVKLY